MTTPALTPKQRLSSLAHLYKALLKQHHKALKPLLAEHIPADGVVFDVGAHAGQFSKLFAKLTPDGQVYAFEPAAYTRGILERVVRLHRLRNVTVVPTGLGDAPAALELHIPIKKSGSLGFGLSHIGAAAVDEARAVRSEIITVQRLDDFVAAQGITRLDFLKADIEGWELRLMAGGEKTLARHKPTLLLELADPFLARAGDSLSEARAFLRDLGYRVMVMSETPGQPPVLTELPADVPPPGDKLNVVCMGSA